MTKKEMTCRELLLAARDSATGAVRELSALWAQLENGQKCPSRFTTARLLAQTRLLLIAAEQLDARARRGKPSAQLQPEDHRHD